MKETKVKSVMTKNPVTITAETTLVEAAKIMRDQNCGILPIGNHQKLRGVITDRDIIVRAMARETDITNKKVSDYMTERVITCHEHDTLRIAANIMRKHQVSRLIVQNENAEVTGILSFGDILRRDRSNKEIAEVVDRAIRKRVA